MDNFGWDVINDLASRYIALCKPEKGKEIFFDKETGGLLNDFRTPEQKNLANAIVDGIYPYICHIAGKMLNGSVSFKIDDETIYLSARDSSLTLEELAAEGSIGVMKNLHSYDPSRTSFSTYMTLVIAGTMHRASICQKNIVKINPDVYYKIGPIVRSEPRAKAIRIMARKLARRKDEPIELRATYAYFALKGEYVDIDAPVADAGEAGPHDKYVDILLEDETAEEDIENALIKGRLRQVTERAIQTTLKPREQEIICDRFGIGDPLDDGKTLEEIGTNNGVTKERIRQIEVKALRKMRWGTTAASLKEFKHENHKR
jgi:RNA polymerase sigma factor (sigma-70 family)